MRCSLRSTRSTGWWRSLEERGPLSVVDAARCALRDAVDLRRARRLAARRGDRGRQPGRVHRRRGLARRRPRADPLLEEADLRRLRPRDDRALVRARPDLRARRGARACARARSTRSSRSSNPRVALPEPIARLTGLREEELRGAPAIGHVLERLPRVRRRRPARRAQRPLRPALPRAAARRAARAAPFRASALHCRARPAAARRTSCGASASPRSRTSSASDRALPPGAARRGGDRRGARPPDRARPGDRRAAALRSTRTRGAAEAPRLRQALAGRTARRPGRASTSSATATTRCCTSAEPATCAPACARTSAASASGRRSRLPCTRSIGSSGASLGSELEAALEEVRLIRELQPPANSRSRRKERGVYLRRRGDDFVVSEEAEPAGADRSRRRASLAARALASARRKRSSTTCSEGGPLPRLRARLAHLAESLRYEEAARLRDRIEALEHVVDRLSRLERARSLEAVPARAGRSSRAGTRRSSSAAAPFEPSGRCRPERARGSRSKPAWRCCRRASAATEPLTPKQAEDLLLIDGFVRRPPPELAVLPLDADRIAAHLGRHDLARAA